MIKVWVLDDNKKLMKIEFEELAKRDRQEERVKNQVGRDDVGPFYISTVFTSPLVTIGEDKLFETMIFDANDSKPEYVYCARYFTWKEAEAAHNHIVQTLKNGGTICDYALVGIDLASGPDIGVVVDRDWPSEEE